MKLYFSQGLCSLAPHIALCETTATFALEKVDVRAHTLASGGDYYAINRKGSVPVLELDNGERLTEVTAILQFIADQNSDAHLAPANGTMARVRTQEALNFIATELHKGFSPVHRAPSPYKETAIEHLKTRFDYVECELLGSRAFLIGNRFSIADIYLFVVSGFLRFANLSVEAWPNLAAYVGRIIDRPSVKTAMDAESRWAV